jgi:hypothetical protein
VLSDDEYHELAKYVLDESLKLFDYQFSKFTDGFFFFYFSSTDQNQHMMLRLMDPTHPLYNPNGSRETKNAVLYFYKQMDEVLRQVLAKVDSSTTLIAMSDHGFAPFTREIHLSSWLLENGFTALEDLKYRAQGEFYQHVDWSRTSAYALGINGIYLNIKGREKDGIVSPDKADELRIEIANKLREFRDPVSGARVELGNDNTIKSYNEDNELHGLYVSPGLVSDLVLYHNGEECFKVYNGIDYIGLKYKAYENVRLSAFSTIFSNDCYVGMPENEGERKIGLDKSNGQITSYKRVSGIDKQLYWLWGERNTDETIDFRWGVGDYYFMSTHLSGSAATTEAYGDWNFQGGLKYGGNYVATQSWANGNFSKTYDNQNIAFRVSGGYLEVYKDNLRQGSILL